MTIVAPPPRMPMRTLPILTAALALAPVTTCVNTKRVPPPRSLAIQQIRQAPVGSSGSVAGVVTVASGTFDGGFAVQDATGGIYVTAPADSSRYAAGTLVSITGTTSNPQNQLAIDPGSIQVLGNAELPSPRLIRTGRVKEGSEGLLIQVRGRVTGEVLDDRPWGWKLMLDDGSGALLVFVDAQSGIDVSAIRPGQWLQVTGYSGQYEQHREILPRTPSDLHPLPRP